MAILGTGITVTPWSLPGEQAEWLSWGRGGRQTKVGFSTPVPSMREKHVRVCLLLVIQLSEQWTQGSVTEITNDTESVKDDAEEKASLRGGHYHVANVAHHGSSTTVDPSEDRGLEDCNLIVGKAQSLRWKPTLFPSTEQSMKTSRERLSRGQPILPYSSQHRVEKWGTGWD